MARRMFADLRNHRIEHAEAQSKALGAQIIKVERQVAQLPDRIVEASVPSVIGARENRVRKLEEEKRLIREKTESAVRPARRFDDAIRTALIFLENP